jgi:hypothetical protein
MVDVHPEAQGLLIEPLRTIHVRYRNDNNFELEIHNIPPLSVPSGQCLVWVSRSTRLPCLTTDLSNGSLFGQLPLIDRHGSHVDRDGCESLVCAAAGVVKVDESSRWKHEAVKRLVIVCVVCNGRIPRYVG